MTDQELFAYTQERGKALNEATRANKYQWSDAEEPADVFLRDAVQHFAKDMYNKALLARDKHGFHPMGWACPDWKEDMQRQMASHILKGDPRDTGWLSGIAWYHGWLTAEKNQQSFLLIWKDATYILVDGPTYEYENDANWLVTIPLTTALPAPAATSISGGAGAEKIEAIKQRLAATPGLPWAVNKKQQQVWSPATEQYIGTEGTLADPEIAFIVNASEDIAYLLARLAASPASVTSPPNEVTKWVPVGEKLPEPNTQVWVAYLHNGTRQEVRRAFFRPDGIWDEFLHDRITHWQPLYVAEPTAPSLNASPPAALTSPLGVDKLGGWVLCDGVADCQAEEEWTWVSNGDGAKQIAIWKEAYWEDEDLWVEADYQGKKLKEPRFVWAEYDGDDYNTIEPQPKYFFSLPAAPSDGK